jgi:hypothetical protein
VAINRKTKATASDRLAQALQSLTGCENRSGAQKATVSALCRLAFVSRNSLYRYHTEILNALRQYQHQHQRAGESKMSGITQKLRTENASLRKQLAKLAALVDHYYLAHREARGMLERRERELANLRRSLQTQPIAIAR